MRPCDPSGARTHFSLVLLIVLLLPGPVSAVDVPSRTALIVFGSYPESPRNPLDPARVRLSASHVLSSAFEVLGIEVVTYPEIEPVMRRFGVRSERDLDLEFLAGLARELSFEQLAVARLVLHRDRLILLARTLSTDTGYLTWVSVSELPWSPVENADPEAAMTELEGVLEQASRDLAARWAPREPPPGAAQVLLPLVGVGAERSPTDLAQHCLLVSLIETRRGAIPDPAVVVFALQHDGFDPLLLDAGSRRLLADRFGTGTILIPRLTSFPVSDPAAGPYEEEEAPGFENSFGLSTDVPLHLSLVAVDCATGNVTAEAGAYLAPEKRVGMFGIRREVPMLRRFQTGTDRLIRSLLANEGG